MNANLCGSGCTAVLQRDSLPSPCLSVAELVVGPMGEIMLETARFSWLFGVLLKEKARPTSKHTASSSRTNSRKEEQDSL